jgi:hypothetical protein
MQFGSSVNQAGKVFKVGATSGQKKHLADNLISIKAQQRS